MADEDILKTRPQGNIVAVSRPAWWTELAVGKNGSVVQILHPDHGWLTFVFPKECADRLGMALAKQAAVIDYITGTLPPGTITIN